MTLQEIYERTHNLKYHLSNEEQFAADVIIRHLMDESKDKAALEIQSIMKPAENGMIEIEGKELAPWYDTVLEEQYGNYMDTESEDYVMRAVTIFLKGYSGKKLVENLSYNMAEFLHDCYKALV